MPKSGFECCRSTRYRFVHKRKTDFHCCSNAQVQVVPVVHTQRSQTTPWSLPPHPSACFLFGFFVNQSLNLAPTSLLHVFFLFFRGSVALWDLSEEKRSHNANLSTPLIPRFSSPCLSFFSQSAGRMKRSFRSAWLLISGRSGSGGGREGPTTGKRWNVELRFPLLHLRFRPISALDEPG